MTIKLDSIVKITGQPDIKNKWPRFAKAFLNKTGTVHKLDENSDFIQVKLKEFAIPIRVERQWLTLIKTLT